MKSIQGFSLIEVLVSLIIVTTIALSLEYQLEYCNQKLEQILLQTKALCFLDRVDELALVPGSTIPKAPSRYSFSKQKTADVITEKIEWFSTLGSITRSKISLRS